MIQELLAQFPHDLERKLNELIGDCFPRRERAFIIYKTCQREGSYSGTFESFQDHIYAFFQMPRSQRLKSHFDSYLEKPLTTSCYQYFDLDLHSGEVSSAALQELANWSHHLLRLGLKINTSVIDLDVLSKTFLRITHPHFTEKARDFIFEDFLRGWKSTLFQFFGNKKDDEFQGIAAELRWHYAQAQQLSSTEAVEGTGFHPTIYLTQTEIDWTQAVLWSVENEVEIPRFPLRRGPQKTRLCELERTISLYRIVERSQDPEFLKHRSNIKATLVERCHSLLRECAR